MSINLTGTEKQRESRDRKTERKQDALALVLLKKRPSEVDDYINSSVTDIESAKILLKVITKAVVYLLREKEDE